MRVTFLLPTVNGRVGGVIAMYDFANGLIRRGHNVQLLHQQRLANSIGSIDDLSWFNFEPAIEHAICDSLDDCHLPPADFIEISALGLFPESNLFESVQGAQDHHGGLPFMFVQAYGIFSPAADRRSFRLRCPKVCTAQWLLDPVLRAGAPRQQVVHIPYGLDHETFRLTGPINPRPLQVAMLYHPHPLKGAEVGLKALARVLRRCTGARAIVFGAADPVHDIPDGITYVRSPSRDALVREIYNTSRVFVCASHKEGFGLCGIEAMASGCALVTTANGGSHDYAIDGDTALVVEPADVDGLADRITMLLRDDALHFRIASRGAAYVQQFDWEKSALQLEVLLEQYSADPDGYRAAPQSA